MPLNRDDKTDRRREFTTAVAHHESVSTLQSHGGKRPARNRAVVKFHTDRARIPVVLVSLLTLR